MSIVKTEIQTNVEMRAIYAKTLEEMMLRNKNVVAMDADLVSACGTKKLYEQFPEQCINMGIAEANMISVAAGMSLVGKIPYVHSFAPFATRRVLDQVYVSGAYQNANLRILGTDQGFWAMHNGGTHTSIEDIAITQVIPNMQVIAPSDARQLQWLLEKSESLWGCMYIRMPRKVVKDIYHEEQLFSWGKSVIIQEGIDGVIFAVGDMVQPALEVAKQLQEECALQLTVVDIIFIKPLDIVTIKNELKLHTHVFTIENHNIIGGFGSQVAQIMAEQGIKGRLKQIAIQDHFGEVGTKEYLQEKYNLSKNIIIEIIKSEIAKSI